MELLTFFHLSTALYMRFKYASRQNRRHIGTTHERYNFVSHGRLASLLLYFLNFTKIIYWRKIYLFEILRNFSRRRIWSQISQKSKSSDPWFYDNIKDLKLCWISNLYVPIILSLKLVSDASFSEGEKTQKFIIHQLILQRRKLPLKSKWSFWISFIISFQFHRK